MTIEPVDPQSQIERLTRALARRTRELDALNEIALAINSQPSLAALLDKVVELAADLVGVRAGGVYLISPDGEALELASTYNLHAYQGTHLKLGEGLSGRVAQSGVAQFVADYANWPGRATPYQNSQFRRVLAVPMKLGDQIVGVITINDQHQAGPFDDDDVRLLTLLADQAAVAVSNARLFEAAQRDLAERRRAEQIQGALHHISEAAHTAPDLDALYHSIHAIIGQLMPARNFFIALYDERDNLIHMPYFADEQDELDLPSPPGKSLTSYVLRTGQPLLATPEVFDDLMARDEVALVGADSVDWLGVPLRTQTATIGVLVVQTYNERVRLTEEHKRVLTFVSDQVAMAIERKRAEEALRSSERQYRLLYDAAQRQTQELALLERARSALTNELDLSTVFRTVCEAIAETFGDTLVSLYMLDGQVLRLQHQIGYQKTIWEIPLTTGVIGRVARTGQPVLLDDAHCDADFLEAETDVTSEIGVPLFDQGRMAGVLNIESRPGITLTVADLRLMTALSAHVSAAISRARLYTEARESEARLRAAIENLPFDFWAIDKDGRYMLQNSSSVSMWGDRLGRHVSELSVDPAIAAYWDQKDRRVFAGEIIDVDAEYTVGGEQRVYREISGPIRDGDQIQGILGVNIDITERKRIEAALRTSQQMLQSIIDNIPQAVFWKDHASVYQGCNRVFAIDAGFGSPEKVIGRTDFDFPWPRPEAEAYRQTDRRVMDNDTPEYHFIERQLMANGRQAWVETSKVPLHDARGNVIGILGTYEDITERLRAEEALRQTQKMESLGVLAGGIAHDFNNLLVAMLGQTSLALSRLPSDNEARPHVEKAVKAASRAADLTRQLLAYSGGGQFEQRPVQLNNLIQDNLHLFEVAVPKNVQLRSDLAAGLPLIDGDTGQLQQVIMNLIINASEAIGEQPGRVTVLTRPYTLTGNEAYWAQYTGLRLPPGQYAQVAVTDTGGGMGTDTLARIFDPFFTTKFTGRGLGLAAVLGIVRGHGGGLQVDSRPEHGTTFYLLFPVSTALPAAPGTEDHTTEGRMAGQLILVIDDEEPVRLAVADILDDCGLSVIAAEDGETGVRLYRERQAEIQLVLLDLSMPGQSGEETFQQLRALNPWVRVILSSGYNQAEVARRFAGAGYSGFIQKPYDDVTLINAIKRYLENH
ncbi:MAG: GAF domain-containing protein [Chloroflexi bacterium]|nr:GAF domain-containing protein [Chloroflexota bacterium]